MSKTLWLPFAIGIGLYILQATVVFVAPETAKLGAVRSDPGGVLKPAETSQGLLSSTFSPLRSRVSTSESQNSGNVGHIPLKRLKAVRTRIGRLLAVPNIATCLSLFLLKRIAFQSENLFYQYSSEKFDLKLQSTPSFRLALSGGAFFVTALILPLATVGFRRLGARHQLIELGVIRVSFTLMACTFFGVWAAPDSVIFGIGKSSSIENLFDHSC